MTDKLLRRMRFAIVAIGVALASPAIAQDLNITAVQANLPNLGNVVSGAAGDTVFRISASSGNVTQLSGTGTRVSTGNTRVLVTVYCDESNAQNNATCRNTFFTATITAGGTTGRARVLTNFTIAPGPSAPTLGTVTGTSTITFTISNMPRNGSRNFYVGADFGIGDNNSGASGSASAAFTVSVPGDSRSGTARATVFRPIAIAVNSNLNFGAIVRPSAGAGTVALNAGTNVRTVTGTGAIGLGTPAYGRAGFTASGEGGQAVSISVPANFPMAGPGPNITVTLTSSGAGAQTLSSALGSQGTRLFYVGGSFPITNATPVGSYSGTFTVSVDYN